jgi:phosphoglucomutase
MASLSVRAAKLREASFGAFVVSQCDDFAYTDPVDHGVAEHQGVRVVFSNAARIVYRLSGTGTEGATLRVYLERFDPQPVFPSPPVQEALADLASLAVRIAEIGVRTGRRRPSLVT